MHIVVTGGDGFIGQNLRLRLTELGHTHVTSIGRRTDASVREAALRDADFVFHLAGVNRPRDPAEFQQVNADFTAAVCTALASAGRRAPIVLASSTQAALENPYGASKRAGEIAVERYAAATGAKAYVLRLTNVFGKWSRPNYNSAVATFCHNLARGLPIQVNDRSTPMSLLYVDDAVRAMTSLLDGRTSPGVIDVGPVHSTTLGEIVDIVTSFTTNRQTLVIPAVGTGLTRALYATYLSFIPPADFVYDLKRHTDPRGSFVEMLKTTDSGQFSFFTAFPGITRGEHYHHTKNEKFLVVRGRARFEFRQVVSGETHEIVVEGSAPRVVETVPGWAHNITNIGDDEMIVMLWANEIFDPSQPDTIPAKVRA
jgi:UDP-2-acetamido-2,6-beta-L-arabino-hexul-4-ose reductase